ncbi:glycoside hydrolase family 75 protein [Desnuesiella massiliensis]|uniref:glycoside hydrolase family 75 protein n=1 Tax=Desnuesiella massiliensis TaxID=1650662 RepID=UPI0006E27715|nr:glycoside hydrolase family 75 protein [Desnuesiella massiliensis]
MYASTAKQILSEGITYPGERYYANNGSGEYVQLMSHYAGATMWQTCAQVCTDGCGSTQSPTHQSTTTMGNKINADIHPYIVLPMNHNSNIKIGDLGVVIDTVTDRSVYVIYAENGPSGRIGEMSVAVFNKLGLGYRNANGTFYGYNEKRFITIMFPGSGKRYGYNVYNNVPTPSELITNAIIETQNFLNTRDNMPPIQ